MLRVFNWLSIRCSLVSIQPSFEKLNIFEYGYSINLLSSIFRLRNPCHGVRSTTLHVWLEVGWSGHLMYYKWHSHFHGFKTQSKMKLYCLISKGFSPESVHVQFHCHVSILPLFLSFQKVHKLMYWKNIVCNESLWNKSTLLIVYNAPRMALMWLVNDFGNYFVAKVA